VQIIDAFVDGDDQVAWLHAYFSEPFRSRGADELQ